MNEHYALFAFDSTHSAIAAQKVLQSLSAIVIPTLREISASCGVSIKLSLADAKDAANWLRLEKIQYWYLYEIETIEKHVAATPLERWDDEPATT